jgi:hypothetical protein
MRLPSLLPPGAAAPQGARTPHVPAVDGGPISPAGPPATARPDPSSTMPARSGAGEPGSGVALPSGTPLAAVRTTASDAASQGSVAQAATSTSTSTSTVPDAGQPPAEIALGWREPGGIFDGIDVI